MADIADDGESLWLSTTRGICRIARQQLREFADGRRKTLEPVNYGVEDGLRSAQCAPSSRPAAAALARRTAASGSPPAADWRYTAPADRPQIPACARGAPGRALRRRTAGRPRRETGSSVRSSERIQVRYAAIHLSAPEQVRYSYKLAGVDHAVGATRAIAAPSTTTRFVARPLRVCCARRSSRRSAVRAVVRL